MSPRGRPPLTEDLVHQRIADYCARYGVSERNQAGFPVFPAGKRETRQHRDWIVLYKAFRRLQARQAGVAAADRIAALERQRGRCPICLEEVGRNDPVAPSADGRAPVLVHRGCAELIREALKIGPSGLDRVKAHLWPDRAPSRTMRSR
jgi:hypothetical protein